MAWPLLTGVPSVRALSTGSKLLSNPPPWSMVITGRSTTTPTKPTVPSAGAATAAPSSAARRSTPRCPLSQGLSGGSKPRKTSGLGESGHAQSGRTPGDALGPGGADAKAGGAPKASSRRTQPGRCEGLMDPAFAGPAGSGSRSFGYVENGAGNAPTDGVRARGVCGRRAEGAVVHLGEQFAVPSGLFRSASHSVARGPQADYAYPTLQSRILADSTLRRIVPPAVRRVLGRMGSAMDARSRGPFGSG